MARRKLSTFERLQRGERLNRKERREVQQRLNLDDPGLHIIHRDAAGIDVGNESHFVSVPPDRDPQPIREFGSWTGALEEMVGWLKRCGIGTVVMQSTGVYWIALHDALQRQGLEVNLVDARGTKNVPGRKSDAQECQCASCTPVVCCVPVSCPRRKSRRCAPSGGCAEASEKVRFVRGRVRLRPWCAVNHRPSDWTSRSLLRGSSKS